MSLLIMKRLMSDAVKGSFQDKATAREYLDSIVEMFKENEKAETSILLSTLNNLKYTASVGSREHIMKFINVAAKLKDLDMPLQDQLIVHQALNSLPSQVNQLKTTYAAQKDKWSLNELIAVCVQEENRIRSEKEMTRDVNLVSKPQWQKKKGKAVSDLSKPSTSEVKKPFQAKGKGKFKCFFCKKEGHMKRDCNSYKKWIAKKSGVSKEQDFKKE